MSAAKHDQVRENNRKLKWAARHNGNDQRTLKIAWAPTPQVLGKVVCKIQQCLPEDPVKHKTILVELCKHEGLALQTVSPVILSKDQRNMH